MIILQYVALSTDSSKKKRAIYYKSINKTLKISSALTLYLFHFRFFFLCVKRESTRMFLKKQFLVFAIEKRVKKRVGNSYLIESSLIANSDRLRFSFSLFFHATEHLSYLSRKNFSDSSLEN